MRFLFLSNSQQQGESLMTARTTTFNLFRCVYTPKRYAHFYNVKIRGWKSRKILQYYANNTFADREFFSGWKFSYLRTFFPILYWDKNENEFCDKSINSYAILCAPANMFYICWQVFIIWKKVWSVVKFLRSLIAWEQRYFSLIWNACTWKLQLLW